MTDGLTLPSLKGRHVLITGGLGFIGSNLARKCLELGAEVTIYDCLDPHSGGNMRNIEDIQNSLHLILNDIKQFDAVSGHVLNKNIIFNCAASTSHPHSMRDPMFDIDVNSKGVINLLEALRRFNQKARFVHCGTTTQLGALRYSPADEFHPEFPADIYSANKCVSEKYVLIYGKAYDLPVTVLRLPNVFGPRAAIHSSDFNFMNYFIGLALSDREIPIFGEGRQLRNALFVDDSVSALILAGVLEEACGKVFLAAADQHYSLLQITETIVRIMGRGRIRRVEWPSDRKAIEVGDAVISNQRIKDLLRWTPVTGLEAGLEITREYFNGCLKHYLR